MLPSRTRYAGFLAGGGWFAQVSFSTVVLLSNSNEGSSKHFKVVPGIGLDAFAGSALAWLDAFSPDNFSLLVASIVSKDPFYSKE